MDRRKFIYGGIAATAATRAGAMAQVDGDGASLVARVDHGRVLRAAAIYLKREPMTITAFPSPKSPGGLHDFFSEADYFWPDPKNPDGPYINRDGQSNPANFTDHRKVMIRLSVEMPALTAAFVLTGKKEYARKAVEWLRAWFVTAETRMAPHLEFSQGYHGGPTGRSYGVIDTLHLVEVARAATRLRLAMSGVDWDGVRGWFAAYLKWMDTSQKGSTERDAANNHGTCWGLQAAEFARVTGDEAMRAAVRRRYEQVQLPKQMGMDGSFPLETARTKPFGYSIFNFDVMAMLAWSLGERAEVKFALPDGRGMCKAAEWLEPFLADKSKWPFKQDVEHWESWPVRPSGLLVCGLSCGRADWLALWQLLDPDPTDAEVIRNYPVRQPVLWVR